MQNARPTNIMDRQTCLWANVFDVTHFFLWTSHIDELGVCLFYYTISCSLIHMDHLRECVVWHHFPGRTNLMSTVRCATCHNFIDNQSRRFIFSRGKPRVISQLVVSFRVPRSTAYKQWNPPSTLHISKIFLPNTSRLEPRVEVAPHSQPSFVLKPGILSFLVFRFSFNIAKKCLFLRLVMAQKKLQTSTMIQLGIVVLVVALAIVVVGGVLRTRGTLLVSPGFLQKSFRNNLGRPQGPRLVPHPKSLRLVLQTRQRSLYITVQQIFLLRQMNKGSTTLGPSTRSRTSLILGCPSMENGAATLTLEQASITLIFQGV